MSRRKALPITHHYYIDMIVEIVKKSQISVTDRDYIRTQMCYRQADCRQTTQRSIVEDLSAMASCQRRWCEMRPLLMPDRISPPHACADSSQMSHRQK